ncbi:MAG: acyl-CoA synthetase [Flavobacteriaceae bacterium]
MIELIQRATQHIHREAIVSNGVSYSYQVLLERSSQIAAHLLDGKSDLNGARIAFIVDPSFEYVALQWAIWSAGGVAVPLCTKHPLPSLEYVIEDTQAHALLYAENYSTRIAPLLLKTRGIQVETIPDATVALPDIDPQRNAMILYTSGTTGKPKGVVTTHQNIQAQIQMLVDAWEWSPEDRILNVLPLHHVHGIINVLSCALWSGASCRFQPKFDEASIFEVFKSGQINLFMAVPTIYYKLINFWKAAAEEEQKEITQALNSFRLMVSGSAALPISTLEEWKTISGQILLERYGMTEMGMAISNPYNGERIPGSIGFPLQGMQVRLVNEEGQLVQGETPGEIQVKGPNVFKEYWEKPEATKTSFVEGWFKTGDMALATQGRYRILGRNSVDIIKSGGHKISALEIEEVIRKSPLVKDCGVVGIPDQEWGEIVVAGLVLHPEIKTLPDTFEPWLKQQLPNFQWPRKYLLLEDLPRNVMGKVTKKELQKQFQDL